MGRKLILYLFVLVLSAVGFTGCNSGSPAKQGAGTNNVQGEKDSGHQPGQENGTQSAVNTEPVTLTILASQWQVDFQQMLIDPVKKKYPHITLEITATGKGNQITDRVISGDVPDLFTGYTAQMASLKKFDLFFDITSLAKKMGVDLNRFEPVVLDGIRASGNNNELYGLPFNLQTNMLYYNKGIFDKFGVAYPEDGMTWDDSIELAKKLTRMDGGIQYRGLDPESLTRIFYPRSLNLVDPKTNKAHVDNEEWRKVFELGKKILSIPGNERKNMSAIKEFREEKTLAMLPTYNLLSDFKEATAAGLDWDIAQYPSYNDRPNTYGMVDPWVMFISKTSKHKDAAMQVLEVLTSDEVQLWMAKNTAKLPPLKKMDIKRALGDNVSFLKDKSIDSIFKSNPAPNPSFSEFYSEGLKVLNARFWEYIRGEKDINTALREAEEEINQTIMEYQGK